MKALRFVYENALGGRILHFLVNNKSEYYLSIPAPQSKRFSSKKSIDYPVDNEFWGLS